ncbi:hypothetical protein [Porphyromonas sp.]|uniref:hypothetical protein n=1 Tax=Porphyromonas sp. TaxID=1924944 RepID=UPI0026DA6E49|nr:hypothetical protein [Porphyromonas sp.]MDO4771384.1 hypothetical protein [Porphyromonas sp.]
MKKYRNLLGRTGLAALVVIIGFTACEKIEEVPPQKKSINDIRIKLPDTPKITEAEQKLIDEIKAEHEASTKKNNNP